MPRVMIVEDEAVLLMLTKTYLTNLNCEIAGEADNGEDAIRLAKEVQPDLILMDISIPGDYDGIRTAKEIIKEQNTPIVFLTSHEDEVTIERATALSPYGYLFKPIRQVELKVVIDITLSRKAIEEKLQESERRYMATEEALRRHQNNLEKMVEDQTANLIMAKEVAEDASHAKSEFLTNMSHELRTPMHQILSYARLGMTKNESAPKEKLLSFFGKIAESGQRLMILLNDLMDLSLLTSGKMPYRKEKADLAWILNNTLLDMRQQFDEKGIQLVYETPDFAATVLCDNIRIEQVFRNLISNSIKYTPEGKQVEIRIERADLVTGDTAVPGVRIDVADQGVGIPENERDTIFEKFSQSSRTKTGAGGTGLGLAICNEIIKQHDGIIKAENNSSGGATLRVNLPYYQAS